MTALEQFNKMLPPEIKLTGIKLIPQKAPCRSCGNLTSAKMRLPDGSAHYFCARCWSYCQKHKHRILRDVIYEIREKIARGELVASPSSNMKKKKKKVDKKPGRRLRRR